jgi:hypothetical protein
VRRRVLFWLIAFVGFIPVAAIYGADYGAERARDEGVRADWTVAGSPCPTISAADYAARGFAAKERLIEYDDVILTRQSGHVSCKGVADRGIGLFTHPVCQFTSPSALRVKTRKGETRFNPGPGARATVVVEKGRPSCTVGGKFSLFDDPT